MLKSPFALESKKYFSYKLYTGIFLLTRGLSAKFFFAEQVFGVSAKIQNFLSEKWEQKKSIYLVLLVFLRI